ncbi:hypothetical protein BG005_003598 [Podila minutissima]|nr:hypothetical protein BG005_003598 [Podila minutissima]
MPDDLSESAAWGQQSAEDICNKVRNYKVPGGKGGNVLTRSRVRMPVWPMYRPEWTCYLPLSARIPAHDGCSSSLALPVLKQACDPDTLARKLDKDNGAACELLCTCIEGERRNSARNTI